MRNPFKERARSHTLSPNLDRSMLPPPSQPEPIKRYTYPKWKRKMVWMKRNKGLVSEMDKYCDDYRKNVCTGCTTKEREGKGCISVSGDTYCKQMEKSENRKFKDMIKAELLLLMDKETLGKYGTWTNSEQTTDWKRNLIKKK